MSPCTTRTPPSLTLVCALCVCLPAYMLTCLTACMLTCLPVCMLTCLPAYLLTCLPAYLLTYLHVDHSNEISLSSSQVVMMGTCSPQLPNTPRLLVSNQKYSFVVISRFTDCISLLAGLHDSLNKIYVINSKLEHLALGLFLHCLAQVCGCLLRFNPRLFTPCVLQFSRLVYDKTVSSFIARKPVCACFSL